MTDGAFQQPIGTPVKPHIINAPEEWPSVTHNLTRSLALIQENMDDFQRVVIDSNDTLHAMCTSIMVAAKAVERMRSQIADEDSLPHLGRDSHTTILGPVVPEILQNVLPDTVLHFEPTYATATYPCQFDDPCTCLLPALSRATAILTAPVALLDDLPVESEGEVPGEERPLGDGAQPTDLPGTAAGKKRAERNSATASKRSAPAQDGTSFEALMIQPDDWRHPFSNAHLLSPHRSHSRVPFALLCIAEEDSIYALMCSALMQRRVFGVHEPLLGFAFIRKSHLLRLIIGWLEPHPSHLCDHGLGVFDVSDPGSMWALTIFLLSLREAIDACAHAAAEHTADTLRSLLAADNRDWRVDLVREAGTIGDSSCHVRVAQWLDQYEIPERVTRANSSSGSSSTSTDAAAFSSALQARLTKEAPMVQEVARYKKSASTAAKEPSETSRKTGQGEGDDDQQKVTLSEEILCDRGVVFGSYPPRYMKEGTMNPGGALEFIHKTVLLPSLCDFLPVPQDKHNGFTNCEHKFDVANLNFERLTTPGATFSTFSGDNFASWKKHHEELAVEQAIRHFSGASLLTELTSQERSLLVEKLPYVLHVSGEVRRGNLLVWDSTEAEARHAWDAVIAEYMRSVEQGYKLHHRLERQTPLPKNIVFEMTRREDCNTGIHNQFSFYFDDQRDFVAIPYNAAKAVKSLPTVPLDHPDRERLNVLRTHAIDKLKAYSQGHSDLVNARTGRLGIARGTMQKRDHTLEAAKHNVEVRAIGNFEYGVCDAVAFAEVPAAFELQKASKRQTDDKLKTIKDFAVIGQAVEPKAWASAAKVDEPDESPKAVKPPTSLLEDAREIMATLGPDHHIASLIHSTASNTASDPTIERTTTAQPPKRQSSRLATTSAPTAVKTGAPAPPVTDSEPLPKALEQESGHELMSLNLPIIYFEYKRGQASPSQGMNQARFYLLAAISFYAAIGMFNVVVFAVATVGSKGRLLCAWAKKGDPKWTANQEKIDVLHHIIDTNCPEWDLADSSAMIRFATFLVLLRERYVPKVVEQFDKEKFQAAWRADPSQFDWTMHQQRQTAEWQAVNKQYKEAVELSKYKLYQAFALVLVAHGTSTKQSIVTPEVLNIALVANVGPLGTCPFEVKTLVTGSLDAITVATDPTTLVTSSAFSAMTLVTPPPNPMILVAPGPTSKTCTMTSAGHISSDNGGEYEDERHVFISNRIFFLRT
ncbi:hypothetical protein BD626DRAFT_585809 [Schizophyllum amplum]|uniref:Uncharacterized protein n=1 Tax=Schizophyllum amplum TaxID=97359 RepID=A0A550C2X9_9AGAR|nr:hypothetical protein BD626DRAFT_585809 [Auriculariopsis ampla]